MKINFDIIKKIIKKFVGVFVLLINLIIIYVIFLVFNTFLVFYLRNKSILFNISLYFVYFY